MDNKERKEIGMIKRHIRIVFAMIISLCVTALIYFIIADASQAKLVVIYNCNEAVNMTVYADNFTDEYPFGSGGYCSSKRVTASKQGKISFEIPEEAVGKIRIDVSAGKESFGVKEIRVETMRQVRILSNDLIDTFLLFVHRGNARMHNSFYWRLMECVIWNATMQLNFQ